MQGRPAGAGINGEARLMKSPLRYQISDYDCGPTSMLNAVSFLFEREQIPPELIRNIMRRGGALIFRRVALCASYRRAGRQGLPV